MLFVPYSVAGHVGPMLPVAAELSARGEQVWMLAGGAFAEAIRERGATPVPLTAVPDVYVPDRLLGPGGLRYARGRMRRPRINRRAAAELHTTLLGTRPDLVVLDPMIGWADRVATRAGVRSVLLSTTFAATGTALAEVSRLPAAVHRLRPMVRRVERDGRLVLAHTVPGLQPGHAKGIEVVGPLLGSLDEHARREDRLLFVSPGTVFARGRRFFHDISGAFAGTDWRVLIATGHLDPASLGPLPPHVHAVRHVPQRTVLRRATVFLTHGGMNSTLEAVAAGVPMIFAPRSAEQRYLARRWADRRAGVLLTAPREARHTAERLVADPGVPPAIDYWRAELAARDGARRAADLIAAAIPGRTSAGRAR
ncbi:nucleotide disphospho-sugar-binding domain-containing protein [Catenuloplanes japonicus]|uniref:nucleotide disphospho-sugar-binding domain-containing protein n=1 Tax=Catenuloplanes japonicus TaxID=33876 RepID=UPI0012F779D4|nr:nucleotide disphospho-sugar-binding domain-containing protein [Catenuloplanes japonicus]